MRAASPKRPRDWLSIASLAWPVTGELSPLSSSMPADGDLSQSEIPGWAAVLVGAVCVVLGALLAPLLKTLGASLAEVVRQGGPGWGFRRRYVMYIIEKHRGLRTLWLYRKGPVAVDLEQVYVSRTLQVADLPLGQEGGSLSLGEAMAQHRRLAILGGPGSGKSTLLAYLALTYARGLAAERPGIELEEDLLPILIPLRRLRVELTAESVRALPEILTQWYSDLGMRPGEHFFEKALDRGRCLVLLDGLDEVADEGERRKLAAWVDRLATAYPDNRYIATSRQLGYERAPLRREFTLLQISDLEAEDVHQFAANWNLVVELAANGEDGERARRQAQDAARDLLGVIEVSPAIRGFAVSPLLLSIIALVHRYRAIVPQRRVDLYSECVDVLLEHSNQVDGLIGALSLAQKRSVLQALALDMHLEHLSDIPRVKMEDRVAQSLREFGGPPIDAARFVDDVCQQSGLVVETSTGTCQFSHLTFQEFLAAQEIVENVGYGREFFMVMADSWWRDVTVFYAGMTDAKSIIDALLAVDDDSHCSRLLVAGRAVAETERVDQVGRELVTRRLEERFASCLGSLHLKIGQALVEIAGDDSVDFFLRLACDDAERRDAALWSLGEMCRQPNEILREQVVDRLIDEIRRGDMRDEAGAALVTAWGAGVIAELHERQVSIDIQADVARVLVRTDHALLLEAIEADEGPEVHGVLGQALDALDDQTLLGAIKVQGQGAALDALARELDGRMVDVPPGECLLGVVRHRVHVEHFRIDKYPVTNARYARFIAMTGREPPGHWEDGLYPPEKATHPVVNVSWRDAEAYAQWAGKRLPTEAEWEKAARGTDGREYPWGSWEDDRCNTAETAAYDTSPVGQYSPRGDSPYGCADMAGNVWEWTVSRWRLESAVRVVRGGSWRGYRERARSANRNWFEPDDADGEIGFRCASFGDEE